MSRNKPPRHAAKVKKVMPGKDGEERPKGEALSPGDLLQEWLNGRPIDSLGPDAENRIRFEIAALKDSTNYMLEQLRTTIQSVDRGLEDRASGWDDHEWEVWYSTGYSHGRAELVNVLCHVKNATAVKISTSQAFAFRPQQDR